MDLQLKELKLTCGGCPSQWEGTTEGGESVYIRLRHGYLYVEVSGDKIFQDHPEDYDGVMDTDELKEYLQKKGINLKFKNFSSVYDEY